MGGFQNFSDPGGGGRGAFSPKVANKLADAFSKAISEKPEDNTLQGYKKGGVVKKTGPAMLHKGERVLTKAQAKKFGRRK